MRALALRGSFSGILAWDSFFTSANGDHARCFGVSRACGAESALMFTTAAHGEAIGSLEASRCITRASTPPNIVHCSIRKGFVCVACR